MQIQILHETFCVRDRKRLARHVLLFAVQGERMVRSDQQVAAADLGRRVCIYILLLKIVKRFLQCFFFKHKTKA